MKIDRVDYVPYNLALRKPLETPRCVWRSTEGFLVIIKADDGTVGVGDCRSASLRAEHGLKRLAKRKTYPDLPSSIDDLGPTIDDSSWYGFEVPAIQFAVDSALMSLVAQRVNRRLDLILNPESPKSIEVNALLDGTTHEELLDSAKEATLNGYRCMKVKIGRDIVKADADLVYALKSDFPEMKLRVDVNCLWTSGQFVHFCSFDQQRGLEYIEDPIKTPSKGMPRGLNHEFDVPIALDESARDLNYSEKLFDRQVCDVLVLKPALVGSYRTLRDLCSKAKERGIDVVFTSTFESSVGLCYVAACAAAFGSSLRSHGLATAGFLAEDTLVASLLPKNGRIVVPDIRDLSSSMRPDIVQPIQRDS